MTAIERRPARRLILLLLTLVLTCAGMTLSAGQAHALSYSYKGSPTGTIGLTKPTILFDYTTDMPVDPERYTMSLNGRNVPVTYDKAKERFVYTPDQDLAPGVYNVTMSIVYSGYEPAEKSWSFTVAKDALKQFAAPSADQKEILAAINDYRVLYGLPPVIFTDRLNAAASAHASYLKANKVQQSEGSTASMHEQKEGLPGFFGRTIGDRAAYFGYLSGVGEDAAMTFGTVAEAVDSLFDAPYHRSPFLNPYVTEVGTGKEGDYTIIEFGIQADKKPQWVVSPASGDRYVPTGFDGNEMPDPLRIHTGKTYPVGYPITAELFGDGIKEVKLLSADFTDGSKRSIEFFSNTPANDDSLSNTVMLLPAKPLQPDTTYHVMLTLQVVQADGSRNTEVKEWEFTTEPASSMGKRKLHQNAADYKSKYVSAAPIRRTASFGLDADRYSVDGIGFPMNRKPVIVDGSSYLYIRDLAAALGAEVDWDAAKRAAIYTKGSLKITLFTTSDEIEVNGETPDRQPGPVDRREHDGSRPSAIGGVGRQGRLYGSNAYGDDYVLMNGFEPACQKKRAWTPEDFSPVLARFFQFLSKSRGCAQ
ncbi:stalk domain-containing protein [Paenibacillus hodogayensis]|uniref:stalk domain-containing protein n=1 Tax=Paenibacillus hodogayensis TaxID=279208 RepID=UPI0031E6C245